MKLIKSILTMVAAMAATVGYAGDSAPFRLDTSTSPVGDSISISWDASWIGGNANATVVIKDNGTEVKRTTGTGQFTYSLSSAARHELTYTTLIGGVAQSEVYAVTAYTKYEVTFDANGGSSDESIRYVTPGNAVGTLPTSTRTGYTFKGWWTDANGGTQITALTTVSGHMTCYAQWKVNQYTVTFNANGGTGGKTVTQNYGTALSAPTVTRSGYTLTGWSPSVPSTMPAGNTTYTAQWKVNQYTVILDANGGAVDGTGGGTLTTNAWRLLSRDSDGTEEYQSASIGNSASTYMLLTLTGPYELTFSWKVSSESGYDYLRWYLDETEKEKISGTGGTWQNVSVSVPTGEHAIKWTYSKDGGSVSGSDCGWVRVPKIGTSLLLNHGEAVGELPVPTRTGYTFVGWWTAASGGTQISASTTVSGNVTYYAHWTVNQYTVTFNANGGTGGKSGKQDYGSAIVAPTVTRTGYTFTGWQPVVLETVPASNVTYTAQWQVNQYTVAFNANGGTGGTTKTQDYGTSLSAPTVTRTGYTFTGWSPSVPSTMPAGNTTYTAQWQINQYTATFNANGGTGGTTKTQNYGTSLTAPTVTRTGYTFMGWSPSVPSTVPDGNTTYTAQWKVNQYSVTFEGNGGALGDRALPRIVTTQNYGSAIVAPTVTREWFTFTGWQPVVLETVPAQNVTYTAQWWRYGDAISASKMGGKTMKQLYPSDYTRMTTVVLEEGITELPVGFFDGCNNVTSLTLPSTLLEFGIDDLPSKIRASLAYDANGFMIYGNWILDYKNRNAAAVTIPNGIVGIGRGAFKEMFDLETVTMPESLRCIAKGAFEDCSWLLNLQFMSGLRYVGPEAFSGCSSLLGASFADGVEILGTNVFENCWQMKSVRLPYTVTNIGVKAFTGCSAIRGVTVPTHLKTMQNLFPASYAQIETAEVAEGETTVMDDMFKGCVALRGGATQTDMSMIPNTVTNIGARAFQGCTSLTAFVVPDSVVKIGVSVFQGCTALWNVTLSRSLTEIPDYAFYGCSMLETMVVPESVAYLGNRFFSGRTNPIQGQVIENALYYLCVNAPDYHSGAYAAIAGNMTTYVLQNSRSWDGRQGSRVLPQSWNGYAITYWTPNRFDVTFDANGGQFDSMGGSTWSEQQITDTTYALPSTEPARPGWAFEGWWTEQTGGAEVRYTTVVTATRTHTIYAHWRSLGNKMTVTFNSNGGTVVTPGTQGYVPGQTFGQFPAPTRRGYTFQGWWTEAVNGIRMTEATQVPAADMELFAHWKPITYYVRFHANGGTGTMTDQPFTFDVSGALKTHTFTRTGFAFTGWATTPSGQVRYAGNASVVNLEEVQDKIVDLYAVWSGVGYSVRFDSNGGTGIMGNQTIAVGETQNLWPCAFARGGYTFVGWAVSPTDAEAKKVTYRDGQAVKNLATSNGATVPLYAVWVTGSQTVRITFDANGGSVAPNDYWDCIVGTAVEAFPTPTRLGFTFEGWWTARSGGTQVSSIARVTGAQTFYAHWTENGGVDPGDNLCTVTFNANGGSVSPTTRTVAGGSAVGTLPTPTRSGFAFVGWFTGATGGTQVTSVTKVVSSVTYYAHWISVSAYTVRYRKYDGSGETASEDLECGKTYTLAWLGSELGWSRPGYEFCGWVPWNPDTKPRLCKYDNGQPVKDLAAAGETIDLWAGWKSSSSYRVCFHRCAGPDDLAKMNQVILRNKEDSLAWMDSQIGWKREGYTFLGWDESDKASTVKYANGAKVTNLAMNGGTKHLYAVWRAKDDHKYPYTVRFYKYDGSGETRDQSFKAGTVQSLLWMDSQLGWSRPGYEFVGWVPWNPDTKPRLCKYVNGQKVVDLASKSGEVVSLYPAWKSKSSYRVCLNRNDGTGVKMNQVILRNKEDNLAWMDSQIGWKREGYVFKGWAESANGAVKYANGAKVKNLAMDGGTKHLYAIWRLAD